MRTDSICHTYKYEPLLNDHLIVYRLFTLHQASNSLATIRGGLHNATVDANSSGGLLVERYEALSYAWGDQTRTGFIEITENTYIPITANLEAFLRSRRQRDRPVILWIDAICINQGDLKERNSQVQVMGQIYLHACHLSIWLGPPSVDSEVGMDALKRCSYGTPFSKLYTTAAESTAIDRLLKRGWWSRSWIVQEVAFGGAGIKYHSVTVRCGLATITWPTLVRACARIHVNRLSMRQSFPAVETVLRLDGLLDRSKVEIFGLGEPYPNRLLKQLSAYRGFLATNPRDKVYAFRGLWVDAIFIGGGSDCSTSSVSHWRPPAIKYEDSWETVYMEFSRWILNSTQSLHILHHCQPIEISPSEAEGMLPTWVPNWSQTLVQSRLPYANSKEQALIPWWSLPIRSIEDGERIISYLLDDQTSRRKRAQEIFRPARSSLHYIPEWVADLIHPYGSHDMETLLRELQGMSNMLFVCADECARALGAEDADVWTGISRTQEHNERLLQKEVLSELFQERSLLRTGYSAAGNSPCEMSINGRELVVKGILCDAIQHIYDVFPDELEHDWVNSALLMVQIGRCKHAITQTDVGRSPYVSEAARLIAFWKTLFVNQTAKDEKNIASWLPPIPRDWQYTTPMPTVLESGRLEHAEIRGMFEDFAKHSASKEPVGISHVCEAFDDRLDKDDLLVDDGWTQSDHASYQSDFKELGKQWTSQPYDLYHRPFNLPFVVPDPYWESRRIKDRGALETSIASRHRTIIESLEAPTREARRDARRFMTERIRRQPAREPHCNDEAKLIKFALGRRFFVSKDGYFGLAPPNAEKGNRVAVLYGVDVPFILRRSGSSFKVVGESYVHGLMHGEAVAKWRLGTKEVQKIILI